VATSANNNCQSLYTRQLQLKEERMPSNAQKNKGGIAYVHASSRWQSNLMLLATNKPLRYQQKQLQDCTAAAAC
jgi:hypothetical protein